MFKTQIIPRCLPILKCYGDTHLLIGTTGSTFEVSNVSSFTSLTQQRHHVSHFPAGESCLSLPIWGITPLTSQLGHHVSHSSAGNHVSHFPAGASRLSLPSWGITSPTSQLYSVDITAPISQWGITPLTQEHHVSHLTERASHLPLHNRGTT